jgi:hypothetical protein
MTPELAVFQGLEGKALVRWVVSVSGDTLHVTDDIGLTEYNARGTTRRMVGMARSRAFFYDPEVVSDGKRPNWENLKQY